MDSFFKLILGFLFIAFDLQFEIGGLIVDVLSDLIGYAFVIWACKDMISWSPCFKKTRKHAVIAAIVYVAQSVASNMNAPLTITGTLLGIATIAFIYMSYYILEGLFVKNKTEKIYELNAQLKGSWIAVAVSSFAYCFLSIADLDALTAELGMEGAEDAILRIVGIITFVILIFFLLTLNQNRTLLEEKTKKDKEKLEAGKKEA